MDGQLARGIFGRLSRPWVSRLERENNSETQCGHRGTTCMNSTPRRKWRSSILVAITFAKRQKNRAAPIDDSVARFRREA